MNMKINSIRLSAIAAAALVAACTVNVPPGSVVTPGTSPAPSASGTPVPGATPAPGGTTTPTTTPAPGSSASTGDMEPNDDFTTASPLMLGTTINGVAGGGDELGDFYKLSIPAGLQDGNLTVTIKENDSSYSPIVEIFNEGKTALGYAAYAESGTSEATVNTKRVAAGGTYYIKLSPHANTATAGYTLNATFAAVADPGERNNTFETATALTLGTPTNFAIFSPHDQAENDLDFFKIEVPTGTTNLRVKVANKTTSTEPGDYVVTIYKSDKSEVANTYTDNAQADIDHVFNDIGPGSYFVRVSAAAVTSALSQLTVTAE